MSRPCAARGKSSIPVKSKSSTGSVEVGEPIACSSLVTESARKKSGSKQSKDFSLPALSIGTKEKKKETELDKLKKKTIRRNAPPGEDLKGIKIIIKSCKGNPMTVQEFVVAISPYTCDNGEALRSVMNDDLVSFRRLARKVYESITQDNSDVLMNQQLQIADYAKETEEIYNYKTSKAIGEVYEMSPNFDFYKYLRDPEEYLKDLFPLPDELLLDPEDMDMLRRQEAYHRLQWLRSEGERLKEENTQLQAKLNHLKKQFKRAQMEATQIEEMAEKERQVLEKAEAEKEDTLERLNTSLEKSIVEKETKLRVEADQHILAVDENGRPLAAKEASANTGKSKKMLGDNWRQRAASNIEARNIGTAATNEVKKIIKKKANEQKAKELSPFHYSPPPDNPDYIAQSSTSRVEKVTTITEEDIEQKIPPGRTDSWGGCY